MSIEISDGYLRVPFPLAVPPEFWERIQARMTPEVLAEFRADFQRESDAALREREESTAWSPVDSEIAREDRFFRRWTERVCGTPEIWPWQRGWTAAYAATYLLPSRDRRAA